jgi:hypothetical protein
MKVLEDQITNKVKLLEVKDYSQAFELVRFAVSAVFDMRRAGLSLILQGMPTSLGAYHILGSNVIVVNKFILDGIRRLAKSVEEYNSYLFTVLAHEYLHSFGIIDEYTVRKMTLDLCKSFFGEAHPGYILAKDPLALFPQLRNMPNNVFDTKFEIIKEFDKSNQSYIQ